MPCPALCWASPLLLGSTCTICSNIHLLLFLLLTVTQSLGTVSQSYTREYGSQSSSTTPTLSSFCIISFVLLIQQPNPKALRLLLNSFYHPSFQPSTQVTDVCTCHQRSELSISESATFHILHFGHKLLPFLSLPLTFNLIQASLIALIL